MFFVVVVCVCCMYGGVREKVCARVCVCVISVRVLLCQTHRTALLIVVIYYSQLHIPI
jgi:hypothetical protein